MIAFQQSNLQRALNQELLSDQVAKKQLPVAYSRDVNLTSQALEGGAIDGLLIDERNLIPSQLRPSPAHGLMGHQSESDTENGQETSDLELSADPFAHAIAILVTNHQPPRQLSAVAVAVASFVIPNAGRIRPKPAAIAIAMHTSKSCPTSTPTLNPARAGIIAGPDTRSSCSPAAKAIP